MLLECQNISKFYGRKAALLDVSLGLKQGEILGLLGPNGAGKTSLIKVILQLINQNKGEVIILGNSTADTPKRILLKQVGAVIEEPVFFPYLTARETLKYLCSLSGPLEPELIDRTLEIVGLTSVSDNRISTFSYGMKQRLGIAQSLLPANKILILDEPTNGLDPHGIAGIRDMLRYLSREQGLGILVSSHLLKEMEVICDRVVIINNGSLIDSMGVNELKEETTEVEVKLQGADLQAPITAIPDAWEIVSKETMQEQFFEKFVFRCRECDIPRLINSLVNNGLSVYSATPKQKTLEDIFITRTSGEKTDARTDKIRI